MTNLKFLQRLFILLLVGVTMCAVQACSSDNDDENMSNNVVAGYSFIGTWNTSGVDGENEHSEVNTAKLTFTKDGKVSLAFTRHSMNYGPDGISGGTSSKSGNGTYTANGNTITVTGLPADTFYDGFMRTFNGAYIYSESDMTLTFQGAHKRVFQRSAE